jgi:PAS domain S-box-containing protein
MVIMTTRSDSGLAELEAWCEAMGADLAAAPGRELSRSVLERLTTESPAGIALVDTDLRCVWSNSTMEQFGGGSVQQRRGRRLGEIQPDLDADAIEAQMRQVLETGVPVIGHEHMGRLASAPGAKRVFSMSFARLSDDAGRPLGVYYTVVDVTARHRGRARLALLDRAGQYIGRTLDVMQTAQELADVAVPEIADLVTVDLLDTVIRGEEPAPGRISDADTAGLRRCGHQWAGDRPPATAVAIGAAAAYRDGSPPVRCLTGGFSWREARLDPLAQPWSADDGEGGAERFADLGLHTAMVVPLRARGVTLGITVFFRRQRAEPFDDEDFRLAMEFVARAAVCVDNARRYTREREAALVLQRSLLPHTLPEQRAVDIASVYRPADELADVGGDWFDVIPLSGARVALVVGDVLGHGIDAAATMGRLRTAVQTLADLDLSPEELLARLDDLVGKDAAETRGSAPPRAAPALGATCLYLVYDPVSRRCTMASAGHPPPAITSPDGTARFAELPQGPALGVGGMPFESAEVVLEEGSVVALYTNGLLDGTTQAQRDRLRRALEERGMPLDALCRTVVDTMLPRRPVDDAALLLASTRCLGRERSMSYDLPADPSVVARARQMAAEQLGDWGLDDLVYPTELVVSELVTNAIKHASGPIRLRVIRDLALICEVSDGCSTAPYLRHARTTDEGGRGLFLISQFTQRWGTRYTPEGKIIWAEQPLPESD